MEVAVLELELKRKHRIMLVLIGVRLLHLLLARKILITL